MGVKVSCVVPVYNVADYIEQCVRSLFEQTLDDIEIIFVNDATPDNSIEIIQRTLEEYPQRKGQVKIVTHEKNRGIPATRKDGLDAANGEYLIYVDGDDHVEKNMFELLYGKAKECNSDLVVCDYYGYLGSKVWVQHHADQSYLDEGDIIRYGILNKMENPMVWCKLVRRSILTENEIVWPVGGYGDDEVISTVEAFYAKKVDYVNIPLYHYRDNPNSLTHVIEKKRLISLFENYKGNIDVLIGFLERKDATELCAKGMFSSKLRCKNLLLPIVGEGKYRKMWLNTYREINKELLFGSKKHKSTRREKLWFLCIATGLYPRMKKRLVKKKYYPGRDWWRGAIDFEQRYADNHIKAS